MSKTIYKEDDVVYDINYGKGVVTNIKPNTIYPIEVTFTDDSIEYYTNYGAVNYSSAPVLTFKEYVIPDEYFKRP